MTSTTQIWQRPSVGRSLGNHEGRLRTLERRPPGTWVYAGTYPGDPDTTPDSEPFQNGVTNTGGGQQRFRYRRTNENQLEVEGVINLPVAVAGTVILTFTDPIYVPDEDIPGPGIANGAPCEWVLRANGDLVFNGETCCGSAAPSGAAGGVLEGTYPDPGLAPSVAGAGLAEASDVLSVNVDGSTIEISSDALRVKADGITSNELASTAVTPGTYGDATHVGQFTVDADGRLTAASDVAISGAGAGSVIAARVYNSGTQSISASTDTAITFDTENFDTDTIHSTSSNTSRLTCKTAGKYIIQAQVEWDANATGVRVIQIKLNGTTVIASNRKLSLSTGVTQMLVETVYDLAVNDYVELVVNQTSLGSLNVDAGSGTTWFGMVAQAAQGPTGATGAPGSVPVGTSELIYRYTVTGSDKASIDTAVDTPDAGSNDWTGGDLLEIWLVSRTDESVLLSLLNIIFNNDTGTNYHRGFMLTSTTGTTPTSGLSVGESAILPATTGASTGANLPGVIRMTVPGYAATVFGKTAEWTESVIDTTAGNTHRELGIQTSYWNNTAAITRLKVLTNTGGKKLTVGTQLLIYKRLSS